MLIFLCCSLNNRKASEINALEKTERLISIQLGTPSEDFVGIPLHTQDNGTLNFCVREIDTIYQELNRYKLHFYNHLDTLSFTCARDSFYVKGKLLILKAPKMEYQKAFDAETYEATISTIRYYEPIRIGRWEFKNGSIQSVRYFKNKVHYPINSTICN